MINEKYIIKKKLGEGRSRVFLCEDVDYPGKDLAIKILPPDVSREEADTFREEYFILRKLNHPNIIKANDLGTVVRKDTSKFQILPGSKFIALEYFKGSDLLSTNIEDEESLRIVIKQLSSVLYYLHQSNYIYYDLKPENILISLENEEPVIKLIDLGFARYTYDNPELTARGTAEYIAPEILGKGKHDHQVDLYSFGMLLYRIIYKQFPFNNVNELEVYKAHLQGNFDFPQTNYSDVLINVVKKLLSKDPENRFYTTLQVLNDLKIPVEEIKRDLVPAKTFINRKDVLSIINSFIFKQSEGEVLDIRGTEGSGKTSLFEEVYSRYDKVVFIRNSRFGGYTTFWKTLLREVLFTEFIYPKLDDELLVSAFKLLKEDPDDLIDTLKNLFIKITNDHKFVLLLDEYNRYDEFSLEIMKQLLPVFQINNIRLIISEDSSHPYIADKIRNLTIVNLTPFTEAHLTEYMDKSFASFFPKEETKKIIMIYADLLPGSIDSFLKDIVLLNILEFKPSGPVIEGKEGSLNLLKSSQEEIYSIRLRELTEEEYYAAEVLSLFEISINEEILTLIYNINIETAKSVVTSLREKNILSPANISINPEFTSDGLKGFIYSNIQGKDQYHLKAAQELEKNYPGINRVELARQFELAGLYYRSYEILKEELSNAERITAFAYKRKLLFHLLEFPLVAKDINEIKYEIALTSYKLGDKKSSLEIIEVLLDEKQIKEKHLEMEILKGNCLISTSEPAKGLEILRRSLPQVKQEEKKQEILFDIASTELGLNNYAAASEISRKIIKSPKAAAETRGRTFNLLGLIEIYEKGNIDGAIEYFEDALAVYESADLMLNVSGVEVNLGNIYNMKGEHSKAEEHWNKAMQINMSIGNLEQEAKLLLNYGIYYFDKLDYETAIVQYKRANNIFASLGDKNGEGLAIFNLGEVYLIVCEYQKSYEALKRADKIYKDLKNHDEETEVLLLLGKFYFIIGDKENLVEIISQYRKLFDQNLITDKYRTHFELLEQLKFFNEGNYEEAPDKLRDIKNIYYKLEERNYFIFANYILFECLIKRKEYNMVLVELTNEDFLNICEKNVLVEAERNFFLGRISELDPSLQLNPPIEYFEKAYMLLEEQSITETTWLVLHSIAKAYLKRGYESKASEYIVYAKAILDFISENIKDNHIKRTYLSKPERKTAIEDFVNIEALN